MNAQPNSKEEKALQFEDRLQCALFCVGALMHATASILFVGWFYVGLAAILLGILQAYGTLVARWPVVGYVFVALQLVLLAPQLYTLHLITLTADSAARDVTVLALIFAMGSTVGASTM